MTEDFFGFVSRNIKKDRIELFTDMKEITKNKMTFFEIYDEAGKLIAFLDKPEDFETRSIAKFQKSKYLIKSFSKPQMTSL